MILQTLVSTIFGYINAPVRKFLLGYTLLATIFILTFPSWGQYDGYETLCIGAFFVPGFPTLYVINLLNISTSFQNAILISTGIYMLFELSFIYTCNRLGRYFGNKTGNIHTF